MTPSRTDSSSRNTRATRSGLLGLAFVSLGANLLAACGGEPVPADVVTDRGVRDSSAVMDSGVSQPDATSLPDIVAPPPDVPADNATSMPDVAVSNACCRAFTAANQSRCDALDSAGQTMCNALDDGTTCAWSLEARCNDSGVPVDAGPPPNCCLSISPANAAFCTTLSPFGSDRCNRADGGGVCVWSGAMICNPLPPMDSGVTADSGAMDARTDAPADTRTDTGVVVDSGVPSCCLARTGSNGATCRGLTTQVLCVAQSAARTCVWNTTPLCTSPLGTNGACCIPRTTASFAATCLALGTSATCGGNANCQWRCP